MKYIKKPIVIEAVTFTKEMAEGSDELPEGVLFRARDTFKGKFHDFTNKHPFRNYELCHKHIIKTLEGDMQVQIGDYIIKGIKGEFYPCKPDIFKQTYYTEEEYAKL